MLRRSRKTIQNRKEHKVNEMFQEEICSGADLKAPPATCNEVKPPITGFIMGLRRRSEKSLIHHFSHVIIILQSLLHFWFPTQRCQGFFYSQLWMTERVKNFKHPGENTALRWCHQHFISRTSVSLNQTCHFLLYQGQRWSLIHFKACSWLVVKNRKQVCLSVCQVSQRPYLLMQQKATRRKRSAKLRPEPSNEKAAGGQQAVKHWQ